MENKIMKIEEEKTIAQKRRANVLAERSKLSLVIVAFIPSSQFFSALVSLARRE